MPEDQRSFSSYLFRRDLIRFHLANSRKIVSDLKQAGRSIDYHVSGEYSDAVEFIEDVGGGFGLDERLWVGPVSAR